MVRWAVSDLGEEEKTAHGSVERDDQKAGISKLWWRGFSLRVALQPHSLASRIIHTRIRCFRHTFPASFVVASSSSEDGQRRS
jgi:hypothetical protein